MRVVIPRVSFAQLHDEQRKIYNHNLDSNLLVNGPAGSGKSILACLRAAELARRGRKVAFVSYNNVLCNVARQSIELIRKNWGAGDTIPEFPIFNIFQYARDVAGVIGGRKQSDLLDKVYARNLGKRFDHVIVDEGQDITAGLFKSLLLPTTGKMSVFYDPHQTLYGQDIEPPSESFLTSLLPESTSMSLSFVHRSPVNIYQAAASYYLNMFSKYPSDDLQIANKDEESKPILYRYIHETHALRRLIQGAAGENAVAVLLPRQALAEYFYNTIKRQDIEAEYYISDNGRDNNITYGPSTPAVTVLTYWSAKGLTFDTVILPLLDESHRYEVPERLRNNLFNESWVAEKRGFYVAMTRARANLYLISNVNGHICPYYSRIDSNYLWERDMPADEPRRINRPPRVVRDLTPIDDAEEFPYSKTRNNRNKSAEDKQDDTIDEVPF